MDIPFLKPVQKPLGKPAGGTVIEGECRIFWCRGGLTGAGPQKRGS